MRPRHYHIQLSELELSTLSDIINKGKQNARVIKRAYVLFYANQGLRDAEIGQRVGYCGQTVHRIRKKYCESGLNSLYDKPKTGAPKTLNGKAEIILTSIACSEAPEGYEKWTLELLKNRLIELKVVKNISRTTIRAVLKKRIKTLAKEKLVYWPTHK